METGKRTLIKNLVLRGTISVSTVKAGKEIEVKQIDERHHKALVENRWIPIDELEKVSKEA